ncbi:MAG: iron-sulfur cluster assembly protein [Ignavibacteriae bacterium]|nr:iron-sulfur cluster assembly protein [Ignavibacteriota bacterium]
MQEEKQEINLEELKEEVIKVLRMCYDPEIPVNIYDLGLIYDVNVATNGDVLVIMTLTFDPPWGPERMSEEAKLELGFL